MSDDPLDRLDAGLDKIMGVCRPYLTDEPIEVTADDSIYKARVYDARARAAVRAIHASETARPLVRKAWIGWWVDGSWCPTRNVRDHWMRKRAARVGGGGR